MEKSEILQQINSIFIDVLDVEDLKVFETTTAHDIEEWDSLTHIHLVVAIEKHFKVRFTSKQIQSWSNVAEMIQCIQEKCA